MGNQQGKERRDFGRKIDWSSAERPSPPGKPFLVPEEGNRPTDVITIRWSPPATDGGAPLIGYLVEHRRTGSPHWLRATPDLVLGTELPLTGLEPGWRYQFRVSAENDVGRSDPGELSEPLTVTPQKWAASAPFFNVELQDTIGLENEKIEFKVQVIAVPPPTIAWYKDGFEVFSSRRTKIITENDQSTFIIHQAALEDEGEIKCTATNRAGHAVTKAILKLEAPPRLRLPRQYEDGLIFEKGELIRLKVTTAGRPRPQVYWYHNGDLLEKNGRAELTDSETGSMIRISDACRDDRGEYIIRGVNKIGEDVVSFLVTVTDRPSPPGKIQTTIFGRVVTLCWSEPEDDGGCKIGSYIIEYFRVGWEMWLKAKSSRQLSTILEDLIEGSEYKFRVRAENPYGVSDPSEESDIIFIPDPKRGIFKPPPRKENSVLLKEERSFSEDKEKPKEQVTEEAKRRRALEEKARRLLDTPLPILLNSEKYDTTEKSAESVNDENVPPPVPKRRKGKGRVTPTSENESSSDRLRITPSPVEGPLETDKAPLSPVLGKVLKTKEAMNGVVQKTDWRHEEHKRGNSTVMKFVEQDPFNDVGPMYPRENDDSIMHGSSELMLVIYPRDRSKSVELSAQQRSEIEMSLAADGVAPPMSLSAPELGCTEFFEQPLMRDAVSSTELLYERTAARLYQDRIDEEAQRLVKRRYSMDRKSVERRASLKEPLEKRLSFKGPQEDNTEITRPSEDLSANHIPPEVFQSKIPKPLNKSARERLSSVERERLEFAMVRDRLKRKEDEQKSRLGVVNHESEPSTATPTSSSADLEEIDDEYEESAEEEEEKDYTEKKEEESDKYFDDDILDIKNELKRIPVTDSSLTLPKPIKIAPFAEREEDTYHPRSMIPTRSVITKLPAEEVKTVLTPPAPPVEATRPSSLEIKTESAKTKIPISSKTKKTTKLLKKLRLKKNKKIPEVTLTPAEDSPPTVLPKPILKNKLPAKKKDSPKTLLKFSHSKHSEKSVSEEESETEFAGRKKKQVRIAEPNKEVEKQQEETVDKNARENQVLIYHYSDIVKEFGGNKKPPAKLYLNYDELKAHANEPEKSNSLSQTQMVKEPTRESVTKETTPEVVTPESSPAQPEIEKSRTKIYPSLEYFMDVVMFIVACCLYLFKNELYAIPILAIMAYKQLRDMTLEKYEKIKTSAANLIPKKFKRKTGNEADEQ